jgi:hypothetical protein
LRYEWKTGIESRNIGIDKRREAVIGNSGRCHRCGDWYIAMERKSSKSYGEVRDERLKDNGIGEGILINVEDKSHLSQCRRRKAA